MKRAELMQSFEIDPEDEKRLAAFDAAFGPSPERWYQYATASGALSSPHLLERYDFEARDAVFACGLRAVKVIRRRTGPPLSLLEGREAGPIEVVPTRTFVYLAPVDTGRVGVREACPDDPDDVIRGCRACVHEGRKRMARWYSDEAAKGMSFSRFSSAILFSNGYVKLRNTVS